MTDLVDAMKEAFRGASQKMHVAMPGRIEKYNHSQQRANIKPLLMRRDRETNEVESRPVIPAVPVVFPRGGGGAITLPVKRGDLVLLVFADRSLDAWLSGDGGEQNPGDSRSHDLTDAIAIPGLFPFSNLGDAGETPDPDSLTVWYGNTIMTLNESGVQIDGDVDIDGDLIVSGGVEAGGDIDAGGDVLAGGGSVSLTNHTHRFIDADGSLSETNPPS